MDNRVSLPNGYELRIKSQDSIESVYIVKEISRGGNCIVYRGEKIININGNDIRNSVIVKEFYPVGIDINRSLQNTELQISDIEQFEKIKEHFGEGQAKHLRFYDYYMDQALPRVFLYGDANNTVYAVSDPGKGKALSQIPSDSLSLNKIASIMQSICKAIRKIHHKEKLYLDCKPDNFFYYGNDNDLQYKVYLFDFDTVVSESDIRKGKYDFCSASFGWVPQEQELIDVADVSRYKDPSNIGYHTDIYSIGAVFFWLLMHHKPTKTDLDKIQEGSFDWDQECKYCSGAELEVINIVQDILKSSLNPKTEQRKERFSQYISINNRVLPKYEELYGLTVGNNAHFEPIHRELKEIKQLLLNSQPARRLLPTSKNRFKYNSNSTVFRGRDVEIEVLLNMCYAQDSFLWMGICGQGGTGKSRLAYEVCARLTEQDWDVFAPMHFSANKEILRDAVLHLQRNILICLDYVKQDIDAIESFIISIIENPYYSDNKIRILLIEREKQDVLFDSLDIEQYKYCTEAFSHNYDGLMELQPMDEAIIRSIVADYLEGQMASDYISEDALDLIMNTLKSVDREGKRPLYALFIADAWLNDEELRKWDRKDALEYLLKKEQQRLFSVIANPQNNLNKIQQDKYFSIVEYLYAAATYSGKIRIDEYSDVILKNYGIPVSDELLLAFLSEYGILSSENEIDGWEPDLIGEYFCIDYFNKLKIEDVGALIDLIIEKNISAFTRFSEMIYKDYLDVICESEWLDLLRDIRFPKEYRYVRKKQFAGNEFLRNISFEGRIVTVQADAFRDCVNLERIVFPSSLEILESRAFQGCTRLTEASTEDGKGKEPSIISIENAVFKDCVALEDIVLPESLHTLGVSVFENCRSLKYIDIPRKIEKIDSLSFAGCKSLEKVVIRTPKGIMLGDSCFYECNSLVKVKGSKNITVIENGAFRDCVNLEEISLSQSLKVFRDNVFSGCRSLKRVDLSQCDIELVPVRTFFECTSLNCVILPERIKEICDKAFYACTNLETFCFSEHLVKIGMHAFGECKKLNHLVFPQSLRSIGGYAFENCEDLSDIICSAHLQTIGINTFSGCMNLSLSNTIGLLAPGTKELCGFEFSLISDNEFEFLKLYANQKEITIPSTVIRISDNAFKGLTELVSITLPPSVKSIGNNSFQGCENLQCVRCNDDSIVCIGKSAFSGCGSLETISGRLKISEIQDNTFKNCVSLKRVELSSQVNLIGRNAFFGCSQLVINYQKFRIPKYIGTGAFEDCHHTNYPVDINFMRKYKLNPSKFCFDGFVFNSIGDKEILFLKKYSSYEELYVPNTCIDLTKVQFSELRKMKKLSIPSSVKTLIPRMFKGCSSLEEIELPRKIKEIPSNAFEGCKALRSICFKGVEKNKIPEGVKIGEAAFLKCSALTNIKLPVGLTTIERFTFSGCDGLSELVIPDTVGGIGKNAFAWCKGLKKIHLPSKLKYMGKSTFKGCISLVQVENLENTSITEIQNNMFEFCVALETIVLPSKLQIIRGSVFKDCHRLEVPRNFLPASITKIEAAAFQGCYSIETMRIPRRISTIEDYTFKSCSSLREVVFSDNVKHIGQSAFFHCNSLCSEDFELPEYLETVGTSALSFCSSLSNLTIPQTVHKLSSGFLKGCSALKTVNIPEGIKEIPVDCFKDCISLERVVIPDSVKMINVGAFRNCVAMTADKYFLPSGLHEIRESAFRYCDSLANVFIPDNVKKLPSAVFEGCVDLVSVEFLHNISEVGNYAFSNCTSLREFPFDLVDQRIGDAAFINCHVLKNPKFSNTIKSISSAAFKGCSQIETIVFPLMLTSISGAMLRDAVNLKKVVIPQGVTVIKKSAFRDCIRLTDVEIKSPQISVESRVFMGCSKLDYIELPERSDVKSDAFEDCPAEVELIEADNIRWVQEQVGIGKTEFLCEDDSNYEGVVITKYIGTVTEKITIPHEINGKLVVGIGNSCFEENYKIKEIVLPDTIVTIGENAFAYCKSLSNINIPNGVIKIGIYAFKDCHSLEFIDLSNNIEIIEKGTFAYCWNLKHVAISRNLSRINEVAFLSCAALNLVLPDSVMTIEPGAFARCNRDLIQCEHSGVDNAWFE